MKTNQKVLSDDACHSTRCRRADILDDITHDLAMVKCSAKTNAMNIQMAAQCLGVLERKILRINTVINRSPLRQERIQLLVGINATMMGERSVQIVPFLFVLVALLTFILMPRRDA